MPGPENEHPFQTALQHHQAGRLRQAEQLYRQVLAEDPRHADAIQCLGAIALQSGSNEAAAALFHQAIALRPQSPEAHHNLAIALKNMGRFDQAIAEYQAALALRPDYPSARFNLADIYLSLGNALRERDQFEQAIAAYRQAIALRPDHDQALCNLGFALNKVEGPLSAITAFRAAIALRPRHALYHYNLGLALSETGQFREAIAPLRRAIAFKPDLVHGHSALGNCLLTLGDFAEGWDEYEWRYKVWYDCLPTEGIKQPVWNGQPLEGQTILLHGEMAHGDILHFVRYLPMVSQRGGRLVLECLPRLLRLLSRTFPDCCVIAQGQPLPPFDVHCPLQALPRRFGTNLGNIPGSVPYIRADPGKVEHWHNRLSALPRRRNVGLCWAGATNNGLRGDRSMPFSSMSLLGSVAGLRFFSLQQGAGAEEAQSPLAGMDLIDWTAELADFADAALIQNLDLVITVDTATAHLAGALGKPVWVLLPMASEWRWMLDREDSPWYPTMRLFRQKKSGDWDEVIGRVRQALTAWAAQTAAVPNP